jgi:hypothetical protein
VGSLLAVANCGLEAGLCVPRQLMPAVSNPPAKMRTRTNARAGVRIRTPGVDDFAAMEASF